MAVKMTHTVSECMVLISGFNSCLQLPSKADSGRSLVLSPHPLSFSLFSRKNSILLSFINSSKLMNLLSFTIV